MSDRRSSPPEGLGRQFEKEVGGAFAGAGVHLATVTLHVGHQPDSQENARCEKQQMLEKVRQAGPLQRHIMAAGGHPQRSGAALQAGT
jgi:hypothetical protein